MRVVRLGVAALGLLMGTSVLFAGCFDYLADCERAANCPPTDDGGPPPGCIPSENSSPVANTCGVFVSPAGVDGAGRGTKEKPLKTLAAALKMGSTIYACGSAGSFNEALAVEKKVALFGGLDCSKGWAYDASKKAQLAAASDHVPLTFASAAHGSEVADFSITAAPATTPGGSSIAVLDDGADLALTRCDIAAGKGADGAPGDAPVGSGQPGANAPDPTPATALDGCVAGVNVVVGGQPGQSTCGTDDTSGGSGGNGQNQSTGGAATDAPPQPQPNAMAGHDGTAGRPQDTKSCDPGNAGADGLPGAQPGAGATGIGEITSTGYQGPAATPGQSAGGHGYGGGGGGGAKKCSTGGTAGPAGGGGGAGGCGGQPGSAGHSAGGSFAIIALDATVTLTGVKLTTVDGATGGAGGDGQPGGHGGNGGHAGSSNGDGSAFACAGGNGGQGGRGSSGGGGLGGHSIGVAFKGKAPVQKEVTVKHGQGGPGGIGGDMDKTSPGIVGGSGLGCATLDFAKPTSCVM